MKSAEFNLSEPFRPDLQDPLSEFRDAFVVRDPGLIYLDGNSLGRLPRRTAEVMREVVEGQWGERLIRGWGEGWIDLPARVGAKIARLVGADVDEVVACDSTSVNFFKLAWAALERTGRRRVVTDRANFPSDIYLLQGLSEVEVTVVEDPSQLFAALDEDVAFLTLSHVEFRSGMLHDMAALNAAAHRVGAMTLWDLSHSVGAVPIDLEGSGADLAVGCSYKYLNGGPGAPAFLYVRRALQSEMRSPIQGWFGQRNAFAFDLEYEPADGISRFLAGTPPVLALAAIEPGLDLLIEAGMERIRKKSVAQSEMLIELADNLLVPLGFSIASPRDSARRGSHVLLAHPEAWRINQALIQEMNVIPDFRAPDGLRLGIAPLYNTFAEIIEAVHRIEIVVRERRFEKYSASRSAVT